MPALAIPFESFRMARSRLVSSVVTGLIVAGVCGTIIATTGQTVQAERAVLNQLDEASTRVVRILDTDGTAGMTGDGVGRVAAVSGIEWAFGLGPATDVRPVAVPNGAAVAVQSIHGDLPLLVRGPELPLAPGTAIVGSSAQEVLGFQLPFGGVMDKFGRELAVVGTFETDTPLRFLQQRMLRSPGPSPSTEEVQAVYFGVEDASNIPSVVAGALMALAPDRSTSITVETAEALVAVRAAVRGELEVFSRQLVTLVLGIGLVLVALNLYGTVTSHRRDFGRRRALGASRSLVVGLVVFQTVLVATIGVFVGMAVGAGLIWRWTGSVMSLDFALAIGALAILTAVLGTIPPALMAAFRDPVRILRVA